MSGSGGSAFLDLLRALAPAGAPYWLLFCFAAAGSIAVALVLLSVSARFSFRLAMAFGVPSESVTGEIAGQGEDRGRLVFGPALALAGTYGALAAFPLAPHVFFADLELGLLAILACLSLTSVGLAIAGGASLSAQTIASAIPIVLALLAALIIAGTANLIEASRFQSDWFGMGWFVFKNPFGLPALVLFLVASLHATPLRFADERARLFLLSGLAAVFFCGGFESTLTWGLRRSLGEDPGFLNHVVLADGSTQTRIAIGGLVFQLVCAGTLVGKTVLGMAAIQWLRCKLPVLREDRWMAIAQRHATSLGFVCVLGAGMWEWARAALWN